MGFRLGSCFDATVICGLRCIENSTVRNPLNKVAIGSQILERLKTEALSSRQLLQEIKCSEQALLQSLSELIETKKIKITEANTYTTI